MDIQDDRYSHFIHRVFSLTSITVMILAIQLNCISGYEEIMTFDINSTNNLDNCSRIMWYPDLFEGSDSPPSLRSGPIRNNGISCIKKIVDGPANINFMWKIDQDKKKIGELSFTVDNETIIICPSSNWSRGSYAVPSGIHLLCWVYKKQLSYPEFSGAGWIDDLNIIYENKTPFILTKPENYIFGQQISLIERNLSQLQDRLGSYNFQQDINKSSVENQLDLINENISLIESEFESLRSLQNITTGIVFIKNNRNLNLTKEINKYTNKIIILEDGVYFTNGLRISTKNIYIRPITKWGATLDGNRSRDCIKITNTENVTIESLIINNSSCTIRIDNSNNIQISHNLLSGFKYYGILLNNSINCLIDSNRLSTTHCNNVVAIQLLNRSNENSLIYNDINLPSCNFPSRMKSYVLNNSIGNCVQGANKGYIQENITLCRIYGNGEYECYYDGTTIPAPMNHDSSNIWSFLAYDERGSQ
jgi:hypothetical protein